MFYFPQGLLCVPAEDKMTQKTLKYRMLLKAFRMLPVKRIMAGTPEKTQKIFKKAYKGVEIPELHDPEISVSRGEVKGQAVLYYRHRKERDRVGIYLVGGSSGGNLAIGMASYINDRGEGLPMPGKIYAGSPGTLLLTEEEKRLNT